MATTSDRPVLLLAVLPLLAAYIMYSVLMHYLKRGLNRYPGPWLATLTSFWYWRDVKTNKHQHQLVKMHRQYENVIRIEPNTLSIARPDFVLKIYSAKDEFLKVSR